ncbi:MAG: hypothetical protein HC910_22090 [Spirulinaceae cyanobacterium SM2_1_0]|nr:hypothetical protein [Spirulinaceae cyanobacterium SM2_1_0]
MLHIDKLYPLILTPIGAALLGWGGHIDSNEVIGGGLTLIGGAIGIAKQESTEGAGVNFAKQPVADRNELAIIREQRESLDAEIEEFRQSRKALLGSRQFLPDAGGYASEATETPSYYREVAPL